MPERCCFEKDPCPRAIARATILFFPWDIVEVYNKIIYKI